MAATLSRLIRNVYAVGRMKQKDWSTFAFYTGLLGGFAAAFLVVLGYFALAFARAALQQSLLFDFQTLITGVIALVVGFYTVRGLHEQIQEARRQENERIARSSFAARAVMPLALVDIHEYGEDCVKLIRSLLDNSTDGVLVDAPKPLPKIPVFSPNAINALQGLLQHEATENRHGIALLISKLQIQRSRLAGQVLALESPTVIQSFGVMSLMARLFDTVEIIGLCGLAFPYARGEPDATMPLSVSLSEMEATAHRVQLYESAYPEFYRLIRSRFHTP